MTLSSESQACGRIVRVPGFLSNPRCATQQHSKAHGAISNIHEMRGLGWFLHGKVAHLVGNLAIDALQNTLQLRAWSKLIEPQLPGLSFKRPRPWWLGGPGPLAQGVNNPSKQWEGESAKAQQHGPNGVNTENRSVALRVESRESNILSCASVSSAFSMRSCNSACWMFEKYDP